MKRRQILNALMGVGALAGTTLAAIPNPASAQGDAWPNKPIRLVVGFAPGGGTDIVARALAPRMSEVLGQQVVVENRAGAAGTIAAEIVANSPSDGYTLLMGHSNSNAIAPFVLPKIAYDPARDFTPITYVGYVPNVMVVHPSLQARSVADVVKLAKAKPGVYTYASSGVGSTQHLAGALFAKLTDIQLTHIPYKGSGQAIVDLVAGQVSMNFDTMPPVLEHIRAGKIDALAISTPNRLPQLPGVPTFNEAGIKGFDVTNWYAVMGPKSMPAALVEKIDQAVKAAMNDPAIRPKLEAQGLQTGGPQTPAQFADFMHAELAKYARLVKELNVKAE
ncbi:MAG: tripartite tricarboxylate transporter substrate binding protein [Burkholderiaceae bacterium]